MNIEYIDKLFTSLHWFFTIISGFILVTKSKPYLYGCLLENESVFTLVNFIQPTGI
jgi:hypothetical protein